MKVAHLTTVDLSLRYLVFPQLEATRDLGWETIGISAAGPWVEYLESAGIRHVALRSSTRGMNVVADLKAAAELWRILRQERVDILHTHNPKPGLYGRVLGRLVGVPIVVNTVHGLYAAPDDRLAKRVTVYTLEGIAARFSDAELIQSSEDVRLMERLHLAPRAHIRHLGNGVDLTKFSVDVMEPSARRQVRAEVGATDDQIVVGMVGRLVAEKGYPELFEAAARLSDRYVVVCIGPNDRDKADSLPSDLIEGAEKAGVRFLGMRTDVDRLYGAMDVFVLPSHREGFPRSAMEAAAMQLPVVATDIRGCRDVVEDGVNGFLVPVQDPKALAAAIEDLGENADMRQRMGEEGRARAVEFFDESRVVDRVLAEYRRVARRKGLTLSEPVDIEHLTIRRAVADDAAALAIMHSSAIDTGFLPRLGPRFMRRLYQALIGYAEGLVLVADDGFGPVGFVAGVLDTGQFYKHFLKRHGLGAAWAALPRAVRPSVMSRVWESLRYEGGDEPGAELLAMALAPGVRGRGYGTRLGRRFLEQLAEIGASGARVVVGSSNSQAISAYAKMGFVEIGTTEVHIGDESVVMTWSG